MKAILLCIVLIFASQNVWAQGGTVDNLLSGSQNTAKEKTPKGALSNLNFSVRLDRTAVWVGDQFHYLIIVDYPSDYEFVLDNLSKETVNMDPFQVMDVRANQVVRNDTDRRLFVDLTLVNFTIGRSAMEIPQFTLYYFRKDSKTASVDQATADSLTIPGTLIETRSTLPEKPADIRDAVTVNSWKDNRAILPALAWISFAILLIGSVREGALLVKRRKARKGPDRRNAMKTVRTRWTSAVPSDFTDPNTCSDFLDSSYQNLKEYLEYYLETPTAGLTADEMREEMKRLQASPDLTQRVARVMETCETLRYTKNGVVAHSDAARAVAGDMREILAPKR
jgi:hypothetical protein